MRLWFFLLVLLFTGPAVADDGAVEHLLRGAQHFRAQEYAQALVEFRIAERLGAGQETLWYTASTLVKLNRPEEAIESFAVAERKSSTPPDALLTYYRAVACYEAKLYLCADQWLAVVGDSAGPRVGEQVKKMRADIAATFSREVATGTIDWYLQQGGHALTQNHPLLAAAYFKEALALSDRRPAAYRKDEASKALDQALQQASQEPKP